MFRSRYIQPQTAEFRSKCQNEQNAYFTLGATGSQSENMTGLDGVSPGTFCGDNRLLERVFNAR